MAAMCQWVILDVKSVDVRLDSERAYLPIFAIALNLHFFVKSGRPRKIVDAIIPLF